MTDLATHTRPEERPDWQQEKPVEYRYRRTVINPSGAALPVYRVPCRSAPMPNTPEAFLEAWLRARAMSDGPPTDFLTKRFTEVK